MHKYADLENFYRFFFHRGIVDAMASSIALLNAVTSITSSILK